MNGTSSTPISGNLTPQTSTNQTSPDLTQAMLGLYGQINQLSNRINSLEIKQKPETEYFKKSNKMLSIVCIVFLILPFIQVGITVLSIFYLVETNALPNLFFTILGLIS